MVTRTEVITDHWLATVLSASYREIQLGVTSPALGERREERGEILKSTENVMYYS